MTSLLRRFAAFAAVLAFGGGCATARGGRIPDGVPERLDRVALVRCATPDRVRGFAPDPARLEELAGRWWLYLSGENGTMVSGPLELRRPGEDPAPAAGLPPILVGSTAIEARGVGAVLPGIADTVSDEAPGVGLYGWRGDGAEAFHAVLRLGAEANRRDRQRFDGAHTTLRILSVAPEEFGGEWTSAEGALEAGGSFCAVRVP